MIAFGCHAMNYAGCLHLGLHMVCQSHISTGEVRLQKHDYYCIPLSLCNSTPLHPLIFPINETFNVTERCMKLCRECYEYIKPFVLLSTPTCIFMQCKLPLVISRICFKD